MIKWEKASESVCLGYMPIPGDITLSIMLTDLADASWELTAITSTKKVTIRTIHRQFMADFLFDARKRSIKEILDAGMLNDFEDIPELLKCEMDQMERS